MERRISVVINTLNEERNLPYALRSVQTCADEVVVVDMHSTDRTTEIARQFGAKVCLHDGPGFAYPPREFAVAQASGEWVFVLDADELVPVALSKALRRMVERTDVDVVMLPRKNYYFGAALIHTGCGPEQDWQTRFFRKGKIHASSLAHQDFIPAPGATVLKLPFDGNNAIVHFTYTDVGQYFERLNRYTSIEAKQAMERGERSSYFGALRRAAREILWRYVKEGGFLDGWRGFYITLFMAFYRVATYAKLEELESTGGRERVEQIYRQEAERVLCQYDTPSPACASRGKTDR